MCMPRNVILIYKQEAGTGEGVKVPMCQSARNADREEKEK